MTPLLYMVPWHTALQMFLEVSVSIIVASLFLEPCHNAGINTPSMTLVKPSSNDRWFNVVLV